MASSQLEYLLHVLKERDRDKDLSRDDVAWAFNSPKTKADATAWVNKYLSAATLLSQEELAFYEKYDIEEDTMKAGAEAQLCNEDFESAISSLEASTATIEKQCRVLESQRNALLEIHSRNQSGQRTETHKDDNSDRLTREKVQTGFNAGELADSIQAQVQASMKQTAASTVSMQPTVERMLEKDDRIIDGLERALPQFFSTRSTDSALDEIEQLCRALAAQSSAAIHSRIDEAYNAAIRDHANTTNGTHVNGDAKNTLQSRETVRTELNELCREIDGISVMAVDSQYRRPISRALAKVEDDAASERVGWSSYVNSALQYLIARLTTMDNHFNHAHAHHGALKTLSAAAEGIVAASQTKTEVSRSGLHSPSKASQKGLKPLRLVQANLSDAQDPAVHLLRHLDIRIPDSMDLAKLLDNIPSLAKEKGDKVSSFSQSSDQIVSSQLTQSLAKAHADSGVLSQAVYTNSEYSDLQLIDEEDREAIQRLEQKTQQMGDEMRKLEVDGIATIVRLKQRALIEQFSE